tara:strand:- start:1703 stop:2653 length:951 start_codon:yes stop_codon:yes gene_type:complete
MEPGENSPPETQDTLKALQNDHYKTKFQQCEAMLKFASDKGTAVADHIYVDLEIAKKVVPGAGENIESVVALNRAHADLARIVVPATPSSLLYLSNEHDLNKIYSFFGPVTTIRFMVVASLLSLCFFIWLGATDRVNAENLDTTLFFRGGTDSVYVSLFLIAAAAIGVSFSNLFKARKFVIDGTYDPRYNTTYWMRFVLGLTSGYVLAEVITLDFDAAFQKPLLALVGGFAADVVYDILERIVEGLRTMLRGDIDDRIRSMEARHKGDLESQKMLQNLETAKKAIKMRDQLAKSGASDEQIAAIDVMINDLIGSEV